MRRRLPVLLGFVLCGLASTAGGAAGDDLQQKVRKIEQRVDQALAHGTDVVAALQLAQKLQQELVALDRRLRLQEGKRRGYLSLRRRVEALTTQLDELELRLSALTLGASNLQQIGYDRGVWLRLNRQLQLRVNGLLQFAFGATLVQQKRALLPPAIGRNVSSFSVDRARLSLESEFFEGRLGVLMQVGAGVLEAPEGLIDAVATVSFHPALRLRLGLMRTPFGRQYSADVPTLAFGSRSPVTETFYPGRDVGLLAEGRLVDSALLGVVDYQLGVFNGSAGRLDDDNIDFLYAARLVYQPLGALAASESLVERLAQPRLALGGSFMYNLVPTDYPERIGERDPVRVSELRDLDRDGIADNVAILNAAAEVAISWQGVLLQGELFYRREDPSASGSFRHFFGGYGQLGVLIVSGFEAAVRFGSWRVHRYGEDGTQFAPNLVRELAVALNGWFFQRRLRLHTSYRHRWYSEISDATGTGAVDPRQRVHEVNAMAEIAF